MGVVRGLERVEEIGAIGKGKESRTGRHVKGEYGVLVSLWENAVPARSQRLVWLDTDEGAQSA